MASPLIRLLLLLGGITASLISSFSINDGKAPKFEPKQAVKFTSMNATHLLTKTDPPKTELRFNFPNGFPKSSDLNQKKMEFSFMLTGYENATKRDFPTSIHRFKDIPGNSLEDNTKDEKSLGLMMKDEMPFIIKTNLTSCENHNNLFIQVNDPFKFNGSPRDEAISVAFNFTSSNLCQNNRTGTDNTDSEKKQTETPEEQSTWIVSVVIVVVVVFMVSGIIIFIVIFICRRSNVKQEEKDKSVDEGIEVWHASTMPRGAQQNKAWLAKS